MEGGLSSEIIEIDRKVHGYFKERRTDVVEFLFSRFTFLGSITFLPFVALFLYFYGLQNLGFQLGMVLALSWLIVFPAKYIFGRERPEETESSFLLGSSFPSGHSSNSFASAIVLSAGLGFGYVFVPLAVLIAFSRIYLGRHYLSDVIVGSFVGVCIGLSMVSVQMV